MNDGTKMMLLRHVDSYWDILPPEIKEMILKYKESQELIEWRESVESCELCFDIRDYGRLRREWFIGHIRCKPRLSKYCHHQPRCCYMRIHGHYWDLDGNGKRVFLGFDFSDIIPRCDFIKNGIQYQTIPEHTLSVCAMSLQ